MYLLPCGKLPWRNDERFRWLRTEPACFGSTGTVMLFPSSWFWVQRSSVGFYTIDYPWWILKIRSRVIELTENLQSSIVRKQESILVQNELNTCLIQSRDQIRQISVKALMNLPMLIDFGEDRVLDLESEFSSLQTEFTDFRTQVLARVWVVQDFALIC